MQIEAQIELAERKVAAIDKRIDAVIAELHRVSGFSHDDYDLTPEGGMAARIAITNIHRDHPGFGGFEHSLFLRRHEVRCTRDDLIARKEQAEKRRADREFTRQSKARFIASRHACPTCGDVHYATAA